MKEPQTQVAASDASMTERRPAWLHRAFFRHANLYRCVRLVPYWVFQMLLKWHDQYRYETMRQVYEIDPAFRFGGERIMFYGAGRIKLGAGSYIGNYSTIASDVECLVEIGPGCAISHNVRIYSQTYVADQDFAAERRVKRADVIIGENVWIGANVFINPGVNVGRNSIIGANSVVTRDVEEGTIVGGVPARLIRKKRLDADDGG